MKKTIICNSMHTAIAALVMLIMSSQIVQAGNTITLECSYDGYPNRAHFKVDINKAKSTVTINSPAENLCPNGCYMAPRVEGPWLARIEESTISWSSPPDNGGIARSTIIDRSTGKAMQAMTQAGADVGHVPWSCHAAQNQF